MIDIETLGTSPGSAIATIGAVRFHRTSESMPLLYNCDTFYRRIYLSTCSDRGLTKDDSTIQWWSNQPNEARAEVFGDQHDRVSLKVALSELSVWLRGARAVWAHGASFDPVLLESAYRAVDLPVPWKYWNIRDTRTLFDLAGETLKPTSSEHHALRDAYRQVKLAHLCFKKLAIK